MNCPDCGAEMSQEIHKVRLVHRFGGKPNTLRQKTKRAYTYNCGNCGKHFVVSKALVECEVLD